MKYIYIIFTIFPMMAFSFERLVEEIGPCWVSNKKELPIQIASFSSGHAMQVEMDDISTFLEFFKEKTKHLQNLNSVLTVKNISLHCGAYGSNLYFSVSYKNNFENISRSESTYCIKAQKQKNNSWSINWGLDPDYHNEQICFGVAPQELILNKINLGENWKEKLDRDEVKAIISEWHEINQKWIKVFLNESWAGMEKEAKQALLKKLDLTDESSIDYEHWMNPIGDYYIFPKFKELN